MLVLQDVERGLGVGDAFLRIDERGRRRASDLAEDPVETRRHRGLAGVDLGDDQLLTGNIVGDQIDLILAVGGGTKNAVWMQATSDLARVAQIICEKTIGASYGNAFLAAVAIGQATPDDIRSWNPINRVVTPAEVPAYTRQYPLWRTLYTTTRDIAHSLTGQGA